jgi:hypothetical protein
VLWVIVGFFGWCGVVARKEIECRMLDRYPELPDIIDEHAAAICAWLQIEDHYQTIKAELWKRLI